ncbi:sulfotransferase family protein [Limimaricola pyoseonensis]|uniref:Sulfotransferase family protein n=1 Tax=Limimaricola pyoseonensis TaxID=521013 RepID=A0A1G7BZF5_9RHOB|nr:sulfotransferase family protein [Limimaricola pyoseonensis]SDE32403.1 Sulfotransferase family protein [Limimaricola pyoseonensis]
MGFPGIWMTESERLVYRVVPKCACSTIGQILYHADHGRWFDGDIHDAREGLHKWGLDHSRAPIEAAVAAGRGLAFTCVRNPYDRILSAFFDKICGIQRNGRRYRGNLVPKIMRDYGVEPGDPETGFDFDQIASFRRFLLFARDTIRFRQPMEPDIHWSSISGHVSTFIRGGGRYDRILRTEDLATGLRGVLRDAEVAHPVDPDDMPRFNESAGHGPERAHPVAAYFDDLATHLVHEIYGRDFALFGYGPDPADRAAKREIDLEAVHVELGR